MYIRNKKNKSRNISVQIIKKQKGVYKMLETVGILYTEEENKMLNRTAKQRLQELKEQQHLGFLSEKDLTQMLKLSPVTATFEK